MASRGLDSLASIGLPSSIIHPPGREQIIIQGADGHALIGDTLDKCLSKTESDKTLKGDDEERIPSATDLNQQVVEEDVEGVIEVDSRPRLPNECEVCYEHCQLLCKQCQKAFYCSRDHQVSDWPRHKADCFPALFTRNSDGDTILVATKDIPQGAVILKDKPLILVPSTTEPLDHVCLGCYQEVETSVSCSKCKWDVCSQTCENASLHSEYECEIFARSHVLPPLAYDAVQLLDAVAVLRCLLMQERDGEKRRHFASLSSIPAEDLSPLDEINVRVSIQACVKFISEDCRLGHMTEAMIERTYRILIRNQIRVQDIPTSFVDVRRLALVFKNFTVPGTSCIPNARWAVSGRSSTKYCGMLGAAVDIKKGDEIHCDYMQCLIGTYVRREVIKNFTRRTCKCERCKDPTECGTFLMAVKCRDSNNCSGDGLILPENPLDNCTAWKCTSCGDKVDASHVIALVNRIHDELLDVGMEFDDTTFKNLEKVIRKHKGHTLHENHYLMLQAEYDYCQRITHMSHHSPVFAMKASWGEKMVEFSRELLQVSEKVMPGLQRYKGRILFHLHKGLLLSMLGLSFSKKRPTTATKRLRQKKYEELNEVQRRALLMLQFEPEHSEEAHMVRILQEQLTEATTADDQHYG